MDYRVLSAEFMRALRGKRSQTAFSRRLGYRSNVARAWEAGRRFPTATEMLRAASLRRELGDAFGEYYLVRPAWLDRVPPGSGAFVPAFLSDLKGERSIIEAASLSGLSRFAVARFLSGASEPRVPAFFAFVEAVSRRLLDLLALFVDPATLPSAREEWERLEALRRLAYSHPWSEAFLRVLELEDYAKLGRHRGGFIAARLGVSRAIEDETLAAMREAGAIVMRHGRWHLDRSRSVYTGSDRQASMRLKAFWTRAAAERMPNHRDGVFSYSVFSVTEEDYAKLKALQQSYYRQVLATVRKTARSERVIVANVQLFALDAPE
jgi:hypothetical protein